MELVRQILSATFLLFCSSNGENTEVTSLQEIFIDPDVGVDSARCLVANDANVSCRSLDFAFTKTENTTAYVLKIPHRTYNLTVEISFHNLAELSISGNNADILCSGEGVGFSFYNVFEIKVEGITFRNCAATRNSSSRNFQLDHLTNFSAFDVGLYFLLCNDVNISEVTVTSSPNAVGVVMYDTGGKILIENSIFSNNSVAEYHAGGGGFYIEFTYCTPGLPTCSGSSSHVSVKYSEYVFTNVTFADNIAWGQDYQAPFLVPHETFHESFGRGGGIVLYIKGNAMLNSLTFNNCTFRNNTAQWGGGAMLEFQDNTVGNIVTFCNCTFIDNKCNFTLQSGTGGGGMRVGHYVFDLSKDTSNISWNNMVLYHRCNFSRNSAMYGGGLSISPALQVIRDSYHINPASVEIKDVTFKDNVAKFGSALYIHRQPSGIEGKMLTVTLDGIHFINNSVSYAKLLNVANLPYTEGIGTVYINHFDIIFQGLVTFSNNSGSGIAVAGSTVNITDCNLTFQRNIGYRGGAIILLGSSSLLINDKTSVYFLSNLAEVNGGAIYVRYVEVSTLLNCFIRHTRSFLEPTEWKSRFIFKDNLDQNGHRGNSIHSTSVFPCAWTPGNGKLPNITHLFCWPGWEYYRNTSKIEDCSNEITSEIGNIEFLPNKSSHMNVIPGHEFRLPFQVSDDYNNDLTGITVFSSTSSNSTANESNEYFWGGDASITGSNVSLTLRSLGDIIWKTELLVNLTQCPPGLSGEDCSCPKEESYRGILSCDPSSYVVTMEDQNWIGYLNDQYLIGLCPPGYCQQSANSSITLPQDPSLLSQAVCENNRTGILCGECLNGCGPAVNSRKFECVQCTETSLTLSTVKYVSAVYIPLTFLLVFIIVFDIRLTTGPANSFILFSQMVTTTFSLDANGQIPFNRITNGTYNLLESIYFVPYGVFDLEFIENLISPFCLSSEYSALNVLALDYVVASFPLLMILVIMVVLKLKALCCCCKCSSLSKLQGKIPLFKISNISQALLPAFASFLLLSYHKFSLTSAYLQTSQNLVGKDGKNAPETRVYYAGQIEWNSRRYLYTYYIPSVSISFALLVVAVFLLGYPLTILEKCLFKAKLLWRIYPVDKVHVFLDTFHGCYKNKLRFFSGLYFLFRLTITTTYVLSSSWITQFIVQQLTCIVLGTLVSLFRPYKANYLNYVDTLIFADLAILNTLTLHLYSLSQHGQNPPKAAFALQYILIFFPLAYMVGFVFYVLVVRKLCKNEFNVLQKIVGRKKYTRMRHLVAEDKKTCDRTEYFSGQLGEDDLFRRAEEVNRYCHVKGTKSLDSNDESDIQSGIDSTSSVVRSSRETGYGSMRS